ncbi:MAG: trypsin-like peptidase domain-containing protein [Oscillospiraceae bacterium]|nr:trypsin-like peptidase domain-containing protein [Oscillospiraceae bacterium]
MKKYPYTESTDLVVYNAKPKKEKKQRVWLTAICSALAASIFTAGVFGTGMYFTLKNTDSVQTQSTIASAVTTESDSSSSSSAELTTYKNGKKVLTIPEIAAQVGPSVVGVINKTTVSTQKYYDPFSGRYYYSSDSEDTETVEQGSGSGIIFQEDGYIVTNQHVIDGADEVSVILNTGEEFTATIVGQDTKTDLAVLKIDPGTTELTAATLGDSTTVEVGELAVVIGNPMGQEFSGSVTSGIISAVNRTMTIDNRTYNLLQTDAAINFGNSGGALINQYGEVIGINSVKLSTTGVEGMGFAIAISEAKPIIEELMTSGYVTGRPFVGISVKETSYGLFIAGVTEGSGADEAGLKAYDMILEVDGQKVSSTDEINEIRDSKQVGDYLTFKILRDGETMEIQVRLTESSGE